MSELPHMHPVHRVESSRLHQMSMEKEVYGPAHWGGMQHCLTRIAGVTLKPSLGGTGGAAWEGGRERKWMNKYAEKWKPRENLFLPLRTPSSLSHYLALYAYLHLGVGRAASVGRTGWPGSHVWAH